MHLYAYEGKYEIYLQTYYTLPVTQVFYTLRMFRRLGTSKTREYRYMYVIPIFKLYFYCLGGTCISKTRE